MNFYDWFNEIEVFSTRGERFYDDLITYKLEGIDAEHLLKWLRAAYEVGYAHRNQELTDDLK